MPWTAPEVTRPAVPRLADERTMLAAWLDWSPSSREISGRYGHFPKTVAFLHALGHDAVHLADQGLERLPDPGIVEKARQEGRLESQDFFHLDTPRVIESEHASASEHITRAAKDRAARPHAIMLQADPRRYDAGFPFVRGR
jgi:hypothetical protein